MALNTHFNFLRFYLELSCDDCSFSFADTVYLICCGQARRMSMTYLSVWPQLLVKQLVLTLYLFFLFESELQQRQQVFTACGQVEVFPCFVFETKSWCRFDQRESWFYSSREIKKCWVNDLCNNKRKNLISRTRAIFLSSSIIYSSLVTQQNKWFEQKVATRKNDGHCLVNVWMS